MNQTAVNSPPQAFALYPDRKLILAQNGSATRVDARRGVPYREAIDKDGNRLLNTNGQSIYGQVVDEPPVNAGDEYAPGGPQLVDNGNLLVIDDANNGGNGLVNGDGFANGNGHDNAGDALVSHALTDAPPPQPTVVNAAAARLPVISIENGDAINQEIFDTTAAVEAMLSSEQASAVRKMIEAAQKRSLAREKALMNRFVGAGMRLAAAEKASAHINDYRREAMQSDRRAADAVDLANFAETARLDAERRAQEAQENERRATEEMERLRQENEAMRNGQRQIQAPSGSSQPQPVSQTSNSQQHLYPALNGPNRQLAPTQSATAKPCVWPPNELLRLWNRMDMILRSVDQLPFDVRSRQICTAFEKEMTYLLNIWERNEQLARESSQWQDSDGYKVSTLKEVWLQMMETRRILWRLYGTPAVTGSAPIDHPSATLVQFDSGANGGGAAPVEAMGIDGRACGTTTTYNSRCCVLSAVGVGVGGDRGGLGSALGTSEGRMGGDQGGLGLAPGTFNGGAGGGGGLGQSCAPVQQQRMGGGGQGLSPVVCGGTANGGGLGSSAVLAQTSSGVGAQAMDIVGGSMGGGGSLGLTHVPSSGSGVGLGLAYGSAAVTNGEINYAPAHGSFMGGFVGNPVGAVTAGQQPNLNQPFRGNIESGGVYGSVANTMPLQQQQQTAGHSNGYGQASVTAQAWAPPVAPLPLHPAPTGFYHRDGNGNWFYTTTTITPVQPAVNGNTDFGPFDEEQHYHLQQQRPPTALAKRDTSLPPTGDTLGVPFGVSQVAAGDLPFRPSNIQLTKRTADGYSPSTLVDPFSGDGEGEEDVDEWLEDMAFDMSTLGIPPYEYAMKASSVLEGTARYQIRDMLNRGGEGVRMRTDWAYFCDTMRRLFRHPAAARMRKARLSALHQRVGQSVTSYVSKVERLGLKTYPLSLYTDVARDMFIRDHLLDGLLPYLKNRLMATTDPSGTRRDLVTRALSLEAMMLNHGTEYREEMARPHRRAIRFDSDEEVSGEAVVCAVQHPRPPPGQTNNKNLPVNKQQGNGPAAAAAEPSFTLSLPDALRAFRKEVAELREMREKRRQDEETKWKELLDELEALGAKMDGRDARPDNRQASHEQRLCYNCDDPGHLARECPHPNRRAQPSAARRAQPSAAPTTAPSPTAPFARIAMMDGTCRDMTGQQLANDLNDMRAELDRMRQDAAVATALRTPSSTTLAAAAPPAVAPSATPTGAIFGNSSVLTHAAPRMTAATACRPWCTQLPDFDFGRSVALLQSRVSTVDARVNHKVSYVPEIDDPVEQTVSSFRLARRSL